jgi:hypothetical protein
MKKLDFLLKRLNLRFRLEDTNLEKINITHNENLFVINFISKSTAWIYEDLKNEIFQCVPLIKVVEP